MSTYIRYILLSLLLVLSSAQGQEFAASFKGSLDFVVATQQACPSSVQGRIEEEYRPLFRLARGNFKGKEYTGCWTLQKGIVYTVWEGGWTLVLKEYQFRKLKEI